MAERWTVMSGNSSSSSASGASALASIHMLSKESTWVATESMVKP